MILFLIVWLLLTDRFPQCIDSGLKEGKYRSMGPHWPVFNIYRRDYCFKQPEASWQYDSPIGTLGFNVYQKDE